jgi:predicted glycosyltransferase
MAMASAARERNIPMVLCLREMKDWAKHLELLGEVAAGLAAVLAPHEPGGAALPETLRAPAQFVGRIARPAARADGERAAGPPRALITGGGGGDGRVASFYNLALEAIAGVRRGEPIDCRLVTGPLFQGWRELRLIEGVSVAPYVADLPGALAASDLIICQGGYNTIAEVEQAGRKAICIPAERFYDDQVSRARQAAGEHSHFRVFEGGQAPELAALIRECLAAPTPAAGAALPGGRRAAQILIEMLGAPGASDRTPRPPDRPL